MNSANPNHHGFSAGVRMQLCVNGHVLSIGQLGPDFIILDNPADIPPSEAEIALSIDGREKRWAIFLEDGVTAGQKKTRISPCPPASNGSTV